MLGLKDFLNLCGLISPFFCGVQEVLNIANYYINEQIRDKEIRLIGSNGEMIGVVATRDAQKMAEDKNLDLVKISPKAKPPVCKIMDFSKFKFEQSKKEREARKKSKGAETKELWLSPNIDKHDVEVRVKRAIDFLKSGDKVKITVRFRHGREMGRTSVANKILEEFAKSVEEFGTIDRAPKLDGRRMSMFLVPRKDLKKEEAKKEAKENVQKEE
ncbi:MAG: translation initiation factor IF-3 [Clostridiales bacterium]|nr:translation initiation factor IF-3 [Clostridiales bacterium]